MTEIPRTRPWLQFHLSTAVVLMFVAAGLLWLNMHDTERQLWIEHGWPCVAVRRAEVAFVEGPFGVRLDRPHTTIKPWGMAVDGLVAVATLFLVAFLCESRIRRRERRP
ncbi:MAG: hypothetical protein NTW87_09165 [Planctomycetota bacterium]|nr:hypothetical protein [Planctomycetota bacterium]